MSRRFVSITLAVVCLAVLFGATGLFAISRETSYMQECASEGFAIDGYYRDEKRVGKPWLFLRRTTVDGSWSTKTESAQTGSLSVRMTPTS